MEAVAVDKIDSSSERLNTLSQELWNNPELCFEEHHAHEILTTFLEKEGFQVGLMDLKALRDLCNVENSRS